MPECERNDELDGHLLEVPFNWLIEDGGTGDRDLNTRLVLRIWDHDATRATARAKKKHGEHDLRRNVGYNILPKLGALSCRKFVRRSSLNVCMQRLKAQPCRVPHPP